MVQERQQRGEEHTSAVSRYQGPVWPLAVLIWFAFALTQIPVAAAHTATETAGLSPGHGIFLALIGGSVLCGAVGFKRIGRISPTVAIYGAFAGIVVTAFGAILFDGLSPDPTYTARTIPFPVRGINH
ncbi:hypothetical protein ACFQJ8_20585 [Halocatena marina]